MLSSNIRNRHNPPVDQQKIIFFIKGTPDVLLNKIFLVKVSAGGQVKDSNWRLPSQLQILLVGQDHGLDQILTNYTHYKYIDNVRLPSISLKLHIRNNYKQID